MKVELGPASDLYAIGVITFELLTGRRLFTGTQQQVVADKLDVDRDPLGALAGLDLSTDTRAFFRKALARLPKDRFTTAEAFGRALRALLVSKGSTAADGGSLRDRPASQGHQPNPTDSRSCTGIELRAEPMQANLAKPMPGTAILGGGTAFVVASQPSESPPPQEKVPNGPSGASLRIPTEPPRPAENRTGTDVVVPAPPPIAPARATLPEVIVATPVPVVIVAAPVAPEASTIRFEFKTSPSKADISLDGKSLGTSPMTLDAIVKLRITLEGIKRWSIPCRRIRRRSRCRCSCKGPPAPGPTRRNPPGNPGAPLTSRPIAQCAILTNKLVPRLSGKRRPRRPEEAALEHAKAYYEMAGKAYARGILNPAEGAPDYKTTLDGCAKILEDRGLSRCLQREGALLLAQRLAHHERGEEFQAAFESLESYLASNADKKEKEEKVAVDRTRVFKLFGHCWTVTWPDARVRIGDTESKPESRGWIKLNALPNEHVLQIDAPGFETYKKTIGVALRQLRDLTVVLKAGTGEPPESSWHPTAAWISAGVGGAGLVAGIICLVVADGKDQSIAELKDENGLIAGIPQQAAARNSPATGTASGRPERSVL